MTEEQSENIAIRQILADSLVAPINDRVKKVEQNNIDFAHYTKAETAFDIIKSQSFWLRNCRLMNDYTEMTTGLRAVELNFSETSSAGGAFWQKMREIDLGFKDRVFQQLNQQRSDLYTQTYIGCLSEYSPSNIGAELGKLSMWRAYGHPNGVALIFDGQSMISNIMTLDVTSYPVFYPEHGINLPTLAQSIQELTANIWRLSAFNPQSIANALAEFMIHLSICIKDSNFHEEAEWRIVHRDGVYAKKTSSIQPVVISGVPQLICSVPLDDNREVSLKRILKKIVIGPTEYPEIAREAFVKLLKDQEFENPELMVFTSDIPYRG